MRRAALGEAAFYCSFALIFQFLSQRQQAGGAAEGKSGFIPNNTSHGFPRRRRMHGSCRHHVRSADQGIQNSLIRVLQELRAGAVIPCFFNGESFQKHDVQERRMIRSSTLKALTISMLVSTQPASSQQLAGEYSCIGTNANGGRYRAEIEIAKEGRGYFLTWRIGNSVHNGVAIRTGNVLASSWSPGPNQHGLVVYTIEPRGLLKGLWSQYPDAKTINQENCEVIR